jgi:hypothetical protein
MKTLEKYLEIGFRFACMMIQHVHQIVELPIKLILSDDQEKTTKKLWRLLKKEEDDDIIVQATHDFFHALFFTEHSSHERGKDVQSRPINIFCICISLDRNGQFLPCKNTTTTFSGLQYLMRLTALETMIHDAEEQNITIFKYVHIIYLFLTQADSNI